MNDEYYMKIALQEAKKSLKSHDVPVGAVIVQDDEILSKSYNQKEKQKSTCAHAEILAIKKANKKLNCNRLDGATIYTTKEPCLMCMGAILSARLKRIVFGASDTRFGTKGLAKENNFNHKCEIKEGVLENQCSLILSEFFKDLRCNRGSSDQTKHKNK